MEAEECRTGNTGYDCDRLFEGFFDAAWMDVELKEEPAKEGFYQIWNLDLTCQERGISVGARVGITRSGNSILTQETYHLLSARGLAVDHGCIITQALLYLKERLERA